MPHKYESKSITKPKFLNYLLSLFFFHHTNSYNKVCCRSKIFTSNKFEITETGTDCVKRIKKRKCICKH